MALSGDIITTHEVLPSKKGPFSFVRTQRFWLVFCLGQILALCLTGSNTFSGLLAKGGTSMPAFQNMFAYILLNLVYTSYTLYVYGFQRFGQLLLKDGWKYFILAFLNVEGNYFAVLAYRYTTILAAQLINVWAIIVVVIISFLFLKVRYHWAQILGILVACGGMGLLMASDHIHLGSSIGGGATSELKGDLFMLLGSTFYGLSNVTEEFLVSKRPLYEVIGQIGFWSMFINGVQALIFDRHQFQNTVWSSKIGWFLAGFTVCLFTFYSLFPVLLRMGSAAFFNISLLTSNFWGLLIGIKVFGYTIMWLYGVAFTCILVGLVIYYVLNDMLGESIKPWLGENQEEGVDGIGTAKREIRKKAHKLEASQA